MRNDRDLLSIINNEALDYAMYVLEERAIPNMIDGFKPVHRFVITRAIAMAKGNKSKFHKLASIAGTVAELGYHHGEGSAEMSAVGLANTWNNNYPLLEGQGNFGSRMVQQASASRYIFARLSDNFYKLFMDSEYAPVHEDAEHIPPKFYLPIIPFVLLNGIKGIATGYATDIMPHSFESVKQCVLDALSGKLDNEPQVQFPMFSGDIVCTEPGKYELHGKYEWTGRRSIEITEIPYKYDRNTYVEKVLEKLADDGLISWGDECSKEGFGFKIRFLKDYMSKGSEESKHDSIMKDFGLIERRSQNLTVIDENGKLKEYSKASDLIKDFVRIRKSFIDKRISNKIQETQSEYELALGKAQFIKAVIDEKIVISKKTRAQLVKEIKEFNPSWNNFVDKLVSMNIYHITSDEAKKLAEHARDLKKENEYWKNTNSTIEYTNDLKNL